jgi:phytoene synthase
MKHVFDNVSIACSRLTTRAYSTSFSLGIFCLDKSLRDPIYSIYGFVRFADEIVDTFHGFNKAELLERFRADANRAIDEGISLNPILNSFQATVRTYKIEQDLVERFLHSMAMDLKRSEHDPQSFHEYVLGSAEVVGLMCLRVFCNNDDKLYLRLAPYAMNLGSAFQKVNFLRDLNADYTVLGRTYFPGIEITSFDESGKRLIEEDIERDFQESYKGIKELPHSARFGVYVAYVYYRALFRKIKNTPSTMVLNSRIRIRNRDKARLLAYSFLKHQLNLL